MESNEKRRAERVAIKVLATLRPEGQEIRSQETEDLSVGGVFVRCNESLVADMPCQVCLEITGSSSDLKLTLEGRISRVIPGKGVAVEFTSIDLDSYIFLKNVVEYNRSGSEQDDQESVDFAG